MNQTKSGSATTNRSYRNIRIAPTTRAIRSALALSAAVLALSGSGTAFAAGICTLTATNEITCNGDFTDDVGNDPAVSGAGPDLTLIVGDDLATTVDPAAGDNGITSNWGGAATVITYAEINTEGADGLYMVSDDTATVSNFGSIYNYVTGADQEGMDVSAYNAVTITNGGDIHDAANSSYNATGILAYSLEGAVTVTNQDGGSITGSTYSGIGAGVMAVGYDGVTVDNDGEILGSSFTGAAIGIGAISQEGGTIIDNSGTIEAFGLDGYSLGVLGASKYADVNVTSTGEITAGGTGIAGGVLAFSLEGDVTVSNDGGYMEIASSSKYAGGIVAASKYETAVTTVNNSGDMNIDGEILALGAAAFGVGNVYVDNSGTMDVTAYGAAQGVLALSKYADVVVDNSGSISAISEGYAVATGITAYAAYDATVNNSGTVYVSAFENAIGILAAGGTATVTTAAGSSVEAHAYYYATGIVADGLEGAVVNSAGDVYAYAGGFALNGYSFASTGIVAHSTGGDASVTNSGSVGAVTDGSTEEGFITATGIYALASNYDAMVTNSGTVTADASGYAYSYNQGVYGNSGITAVGIDAMAPYGDASVTNSGTVIATAYGYAAYGSVIAYGISGYSIDGSVTVTNSGSVSASASNDPGYSAKYGAQAYGISAYSFNGDVAVTNSGTVSASATDAYANVYRNIADGIYAGSVYGDVAVTNSGTINASASAYNAVDASVASGIYAYSYTGDVSVANTGSVSAETSDFAVVGNITAAGITASAYFGDASVSNAGTVSANAYGYAAVGAVVAGGIVAYSYDGDLTVSNSGSASATASNHPDYAAKYGAHATGISAYAYNGDVAVSNSGTVSAAASDSYYNDSGNRAEGIYAGSYYGDVAVTNSGSVSASASSYAAYDGNVARGIDAYSHYGDVTVTNSGTVSAAISGLTYYNAYYASTGRAVGINADAYLGTASVESSGTINATAEYGNAFGVSAVSAYGSVDVTNSGDINVTAVGSHYIGPLPDEYVYVGGVAIGILAYGYTGVDVDNSGSIDVSGYVVATGIYATGGYFGYGDVAVENSGTITVNSGPDYYFASYATGIYAYNYGGDTSVVNSGLIDVTATAGIGTDAGEYTLLGNAEAIGIYANTGAYGLGDISIDNSGTVLATATTFSVYYGPSAYGIEAYGKYGDVAISNSGSISATARSNYYQFNSVTTAVGVAAVEIGYYGEDNGSLAVENSGTISADASAYYGGASAAGIYAVTIYGDLSVDSSGSISASATSGDYSAYSLADATGISAINFSPYYYYGNVSVANSGTIDATASSGYSTYFSSALAIGIAAENIEGSVTVDNSGVISATAGAGVDSDYAFDNQADAYGIVAYNYDGDLSVVNTGVITATASSGGYYGYANATGISALVGVDGYGYIDIYNNGAITATAEDNATGILAQSYGGYYGGAVYVGNGEDGVIEASAVGGDYVYATGVRIDGTYAYFHNDGEISANAEGYIGDSVGVYLHSYGSFIAYNDGDISATAAGEFVEAVGFFAGSEVGTATLFNSGDILASAEYQATGVWLGSSSYTYLYNYGSIEASGADYNYAIDTSYGGSIDYIYNQGTITGAIRTGAGNDYLYNGVDGTWNATGVSTFADGDDGIWNEGVIAMSDATIDLGFHDVTGNYFYNYGELAADGTNVINMGDGPVAPLVPSLNPLAFYNYGTIDFQDGDAEDLLTIVGDFAGDGDINVDVSGLDGTSDILYIDGSVVAGTAGTINVELLDLPESIESIVPMVYVSGDSVAGNFALGEVSWDEDNSFVTLDFSLIADIDADNSDPDVFSLGIEVTGLSDPGTLAASVGPSVLSLVNTQVGTWRQRMGVIDSFNKGAVALWARVFSSEGSFQPSHAGDFVGGNFDFEQKNSGVEAGIDFSVTDEFSIGLLLAKSQADVDLDGAGNGGTDLDADTWGLYGTWISPNGFYLDASYRWTDFDVDLNSVAGNMETSGDAETFNIEAGYAWTLSGGLKIEPQLQYTKTTVDNIDVLHTINGMTFSYDDADSSRGRLGVAIRKGFGEADTGWLWTPYAALSVVREFDGETLYSVNNVFHGESDMEGTSMLLELGFTARHQNWAVYGGLNFEDGGAVEGFFGGQLGVRYTFGGPAPAPVVVVPPPAKTCADLDDDGDGVNNCDDKCLGSTAGEAVGPDGCPVPPEPVVEPKPFRG